MSSSKPIRIMLVDDHAVVRAGLRHLLESTGEFEVAGESGDGIDAVKMASEILPDIIVMDVMLPRMDGVDACREIMGLLPGTKVLVLTASTSEDAVVEAVAAGATGYLQKFTGEDEFLDSLRDVAAGQLRLPSDTVRRVFQSIRAEPAQLDGVGPDSLTLKEKEYLVLFSRGLTYAEISQSKGNSHYTIRNTLHRVQQKLDVRTKVEMVVWAVRNGLLDDTDFW